MSRRPPPPVAPHLYRWIVDGHNLLLSLPRWARLHRLGREREAREALDRWIEAFGRAVGVKPWLVYDGAEVEVRREGFDAPHLRILYTHPPAEADDHIRVLAAAAVHAGEAVCVVSSDRRTLANSLPQDVCILSVSAFGSLHQKCVNLPEKWVPPEDLDDVERHFLASSPFASDRIAAGDPPTAPSGPSPKDDEPPERPAS